MGKFDNVFEWFHNLWNLTSKKKKLGFIRTKWAQDVDIWRDPDLVNIYHEKNKNESKKTVDEKTWSDLRLWDVFQKIDRTVSTPGRQILYDKFKTYNSDARKDDEFFKLVELFRNDKELRESIQLQLMSMETTQSYFLPIVLEEKEDKIRPPFLFHFLGYTALAITFLIPIKPILILALIGIALVNICVNYYFTKKVYNYFPTYYYLGIMARACVQINKKVSLPDHNVFKIVKSSLGLSKKIKRRMGTILTDRSAATEVEQVAFEYLNMVALYDLRIYLKANEMIKNFNFEIKTLFKVFGTIDAAISIASFVEQNQKFTRPKFNKLNKIELLNVYHPLIDNAVANSINLDDRSLLITGSNMSGKTTFMKTVGVNFILAQTIGIVLADKADIPNLKVLSSIKVEDNLDEGKSYYQVEVDDLLKFLNKDNEINQYLFLIDEIYRGTNTVERISAATAVLKHLSRHNLTFVTTHDIELQNLLGDKYEMKHFSECVDGERFYFDYQLKDGPCKTRNAIKLLELSGYPKELVSDAYELAENFSN